MEPILGSLMLFAGSYAPKDWAICNGQLLPIRSYTGLFSILGNNYGGDGKISFGLPDLRGRVPAHYASPPAESPHKIGDMYGTETIVLTTRELPTHTHAAAALTGIGVSAEAEDGSDSPVDSYLQPTPGQPTYALGGGAFMGPSPMTVTLSATGQQSPDAISLIQPSLGMNYCIALSGIFPSRP